MRKKSLVAILLALVFLFQAVLPAHAGKGTISIKGLLNVPYSLYINEDKDSAATLPKQDIKRTVGDKDSTRQSVVWAPTEGGRFDFNASFKIKQSTSAFITTLWKALVKPSADEINKMSPTQATSIKSYVDLVVEVDSRVTPASQISAYFDAFTWRPVYIFDKNYKLLADVRNSYVKGQSKKEFTFPSEGKTEYIIRVVPIGGENFTKAQQDEPLKLGFDGIGNNNFTISADKANEVAKARREMSDEDLAKEAKILAKKDILTQDEISFLKKYNIYSSGKTLGQVTGDVPLLGLQTEWLGNKIQPAGIAVGYENVKVRFFEAVGDKVQKIEAPAYIGYNETFNTNSVPNVLFPNNPLAIKQNIANKNLYTFKGWHKVAADLKNPLAKIPNDLIANLDSVKAERFVKDTDFYAIWVKEEVAVTFDKNYPGAENKETVKQVAKGEALGAGNIPTDPTRSGYVFKGWAKSDSAGASEVISKLEDEIINEAATFYAIWVKEATAPEKITLSYKFISGSTSFKELPEEVKKNLPAIISTQVDKGSTLTKDNIRPLSEFENVQVTVQQKDAQQQIKTVVWKVDRENLEYVYRDLTHKAFVDTNYHVPDVRDNVDYGIALVPFEQIKVTFYNNHDASDKSFVKQVILDEGSSTSVPQVPQRSGFEFLGWSKNAAATVADTPQPQNEDRYNVDTDFYAIWKQNAGLNPPVAKQVKVSFDKNYGEEKDRVIQEEVILEGNSISALPQNPVRNGFEFLGWSKNVAATVADTPQPQNEDKYNVDTVFYAVWKQQSNSNPPTTKEVKVSFDKNYGEEKDRIIQEEVIAEGTAISALPKNPTREGYTFLGWAKESNLTIADAIQPKIDDLYNEDTTFYAIWKKTETPNTGGGGGGGSIGIPAPNKPQAPQKSENTHKKPKVSEALNTTKRVQYVLGYADGTIKPNAFVTRAELTTFYYRLLTDKKRDEIFTDMNTFKDVSKSSWYNKAISSMSRGKYVSGYPDGTFGANRLMTRAEFMSVTARFLDKKTSDKTFSDVSAKHWAKDVISTGVYYGLLSGYEDGTFRPDKPITRAEAIAIINRLLDRKLDENSLRQMNYKKWVDNEKGAWYYYDVIEATHDYTQVEKSK